MSTREQTIDDHRERLNRVLVFIQENIEQPMRLRALASIAHFSPFHFHRIFAAYVGETLSEYVRRVRLDKAAHRLYYSSESITDIALKAGYETPAAFTRAFRLHFGKTPTQFKNLKRPGLPKHLDLIDNLPVRRRGKPMKTEIRTLPEQKVLFVRKTGRYDKAASEAWPILMKFAYSRRILNEETRSIGIGHDSPNVTPEEKIRYDACITFKGGVKPEGEIGIETIAGGKYAVFLHKGPHNKLDQAYNYIMSEWYPESGKNLRHLPCFEMYLNRDPHRTKPENLRTEIYVPIE